MVKPTCPIKPKKNLHGTITLAYLVPPSGMLKKYIALAAEKDVSSTTSLKNSRFCNHLKL
jgi:hypothetical protein